MRKYKKLSQAQKISCLIVDEELAAIEQGLRSMQAKPDSDR